MSHSFSSLSDSELAFEAAKNPEAFGVLYDRYVRQVYAFVASRLQCRCEAEDVTSEVWMRVLQKIADFQPRRPESLVAWIFTIARNAITDAIRKRRPGESIDIDEVVELASEEEHPGKRIDQRKQFVALQHSLDQLPTQQAHCLRLRYYGGLRNIDIAELEGLSEKTVASNISRGLDALRSLQPELSSVLSTL